MVLRIFNSLDNHISYRRQSYQSTKIARHTIEMDIPSALNSVNMIVECLTQKVKCSIVLFEYELALLVALQGESREVGSR